MPGEDRQRSISFEMCVEQQHLRLLELPPKLHEAITSTNPPHLLLKSAPPGSTNGALQDANAVLCTNNETFAIRQVSSSNSLFVLQPGTGQQQGDSILSPTPSIVAIAKCPTTLELLPSSPSCQALLQELLLPYNSQDQAEQLLRNNEPSSPSTNKHDLLNDVPISEGEFTAAWTSLCAFEWQSRCWRPTPSACLTTWKAFFDAAFVNGTDLNGPFQRRQAVDSVEETGDRGELLGAVFARLAVDASEQKDAGSAQDVQLDRSKCVAWTGEIILGSMSNSGNADLDEYMQRWRDPLPEKWRQDAKLELIQGKYYKPTPTTIAYSSSGVGPGSANSQASTGGKPVRKWHEKFKNSRK